MDNQDDRFAPPPTATHGVVTPPAQPPSNPAPTGSGSTGRTALIAVVVTLAVVVVVGGAYLLGRSGDGASAPTTTATATTTTVTETTTTAAQTTTASTTAAAPSPAPAPPIGDVRQAPDGLLCKDLEAKGYSYAAAVDYWRVWGQPNRMDADKNGIPCETVYPRADVVAFWPRSTYNQTISYGFPSGLLCRDLQNRGADVYDALRYYIWEGYPSRMDADGNGIPCESVYPHATEVWLLDF